MGPIKNRPNPFFRGEIRLVQQVRQPRVGDPGHRVAEAVAKRDVFVYLRSNVCFSMNKHNE